MKSWSKLESEAALATIKSLPKIGDFESHFVTQTISPGTWKGGEPLVLKPEEIVARKELESLRLELANVKKFTNQLESLSQSQHKRIQELQKERDYAREQRDELQFQVDTMEAEALVASTEPVIDPYAKIDDQTLLIDLKDPIDSAALKETIRVIAEDENKRHGISTTDSDVELVYELVVKVLSIYTGVVKTNQYMVAL